MVVVLTPMGNYSSSYRAEPQVTPYNLDHYLNSDDLVICCGKHVTKPDEIHDELVMAALNHILQSVVAVPYVPSYYEIWKQIHPIIKAFLEKYGTSEALLNEIAVARGGEEGVSDAKKWLADPNTYGMNG